MPAEPRTGLRTGHDGGCGSARREGSRVSHRHRPPLSLRLPAGLLLVALAASLAPAGTTNYTYDLADRITSAGFAYDANGNLTADPGRTFAYDAFGRQTSVTASGTTTTYTADGLGNRLAETTGAATTAFDLDLAQANPTILADGTRRYLPGAPGAGSDTAGTWWSSLTDLSGSPIRSVSQTGATTAAVHRDPYGTARPGSTSGPGIGYTGEWADPTGLVNLRARAYDPLSARFIARDSFAGVASAPPERQPLRVRP